MKERKQVKVEMGFIRKPLDIVNEMERIANKFAKDKWSFINSNIENDFKTIILTFEREIDN